MCPVCIATAALIAGKAASTGGLAALAVKKTWHRLQPVDHVEQPLASESAITPAQYRAREQAGAFGAVTAMQVDNKSLHCRETKLSEARQ